MPKCGDLIHKTMPEALSWQYEIFLGSGDHLRTLLMFI